MTYLFMQSFGHLWSTTHINKRGTSITFEDRHARVRWRLAAPVMKNWEADRVVSGVVNNHKKHMGAAA